MPSQPEDKAFRQRIQRVETLLHQIEGHADPAVRAQIQELVQTLLDYHGTALARLLEYIAQAGAGGHSLMTALCSDDLVGSLLLLYGLHPLDADARVRQAVEKLRPFLRGHGGQLELVDNVGGVVRLRFESKGHSCASTAKTLQQTIEDTIYEAAPEITSIEIEGLVPPASAGVTFVPVEELLAGNRRTPCGKVTIS
jgi:Fe-S cluster biogenesis protein NfuA